MVCLLVVSFVAVSAGIVHVGAIDKVVEGEYLWVDGTTFNGAWGSGQPNNMEVSGEDQDCIIVESAFSYDFSDIQCSNSYKYLCQIRL